MNNGEIEVSVVMPCLNEELTIGKCIEKCKRAFNEKKIAGEIVVSDNGSTDRSVEIASSLGARVVYQPKKGYGNAYRKGIEAASGKYIVMGDSDDTYDFFEIESFVQLLKEGFDFVIGSRFKGKILANAMPWPNRYIGNPILSGMLRLFFHTKISDAHCGMRSFTKEAYEKMNLKTTGMEFASEMVVNALRAKLKIKEIPITYHPRLGESKLNAFKDAWRHIRFMLLYSPTYLYLVPGMFLMGLGIVIQIGIWLGIIKIFGHTFDTHSMVFGSFLIVLGFQILNLGFYAKTYAFTEGFEETNKALNALYKYFRLEQGLLAGSCLFLLGLILGIFILIKWAQNQFGPLAEMKLALLSLTLAIIGVQIIFSSFFLSMLGIEKRQ